MPFAELAKAEAGLKAAGVPVTSQALPGLAHDIDERGLTLGSRFLTEIFSR